MDIFDDPGDLGFFDETDHDPEPTDEDLSNLFHELLPGEGDLD